MNLIEKARIHERIPTIKDLIRRLKNNFIFRLDYGFLLSDTILSEVAYSRLITKLRVTNILERVQETFQHQAISEGFIIDDTAKAEREQWLKGDKLNVRLTCHFRQMMKSQGGDISVGSEELVGTVFRLRLPLNNHQVTQRLRRQAKRASKSASIGVRSGRTHVGAASSSAIGQLHKVFNILSSVIV